MYFYKRGAVWGEAVKRYLRGEEEGKAREQVIEEVEGATGKDGEAEVRQRTKG